jgi:hypothetical protein
VEAFLQESELSELSSELIESNVRIQEMIESITTFPDEILTVERKLNILQQSKNEKNEKLNAISQEIKQSNVENIRNWEEQKQKYSDEKDGLKVKIGLKENQRERRENIIRALNIKMKQELKKESKHSSLLGLLAFCDECIKCAQETKETIMREVKEQVEKKASEQFLALIWKKDTYKGVVIDDDYNISVPHVTGREALGSLSAGERQVCALAFMAALNSVSGFKVPIIIDTPLARISSTPRKNIAEIKVDRFIRLSYDTLDIGPFVKEAIELLKSHGIDGRNILVYTLYNFTDSPQDLFVRIKNILSLGAVAYPMRFQPVNTLKKNSYVAHRWDEVRLNAVQSARRVIGSGGAFPPYEGMIKVKVEGCTTFDEAFAEFMQPVEVVQ